MTNSNRKSVAIVEGIIGAGKTTFATELAKALGDRTLLLLEPDEKNKANPYLKDYYEDPGRWALVMQVHLLQARYRMHLTAQWHAMQGVGHAVLDRSYFGDTAFARLQILLGHMPQREYETYQSIYQAMTASVLFPTVCVHLRVSPKTAAERIRRRMEQQTGRKVESVVDEGYLRGLDEQIGLVMEVLRQQGVRIVEVMWDEDRQDEEARRDVIGSLASTIASTPHPDFFTNLHRRGI